MAEDRKPNELKETWEYLTTATRRLILIKHQVHPDEAALYAEKEWDDLPNFVRISFGRAFKGHMGNQPRRMHLRKKGAVEVAEQIMRTASPEAAANLAFEAAEKEARAMGRRHGTTAAEWVLQDLLGGRAPGNVKERAKIILEQYEAGDPALMDRFRVPDLSGEYAGDPTPAMLHSALGIEAPQYADWWDEVEMAFIEGAEEGFWDTLISAAREAVTEENPPRRRPRNSSRFKRRMVKREPPHKCPGTERCGECSQPMCQDCSCKGVGRPDTCIICYGGNRWCESCGIRAKMAGNDYCEVCRLDANDNPQGGLTVIGERAILVQTSGGSVKRGMGRVLGKPDGSILIEGTFTGPRSTLERFVNGKLEEIWYYDRRKARAEGKPNPRLPWRHEFSTEQVQMTITSRGLHIKADRPLWGIQ